MVAYRSLDYIHRELVGSIQSRHVHWLDVARLDNVTATFELGNERREIRFLSLAATLAISNICRLLGHGFPLPRQLQLVLVFENLCLGHDVLVGTFLRNLSINVCAIKHLLDTVVGAPGFNRLNLRLVVGQ